MPEAYPSDQPPPDWHHVFSHRYDAIFGIEKASWGFGLPRFSRTTVFAAVCLIVAFLVFGRTTLDALTTFFGDGEVSRLYPELARGVMVDLAAMLAFALLIDSVAIYVSVAKERVILSWFYGAGLPRRLVYGLIDVVLSLLLFLFVFQILRLGRELTVGDFAAHLPKYYESMPRDAANRLIREISAVYLALQLAFAASVFVPLAWLFVYAGGVLFVGWARRVD
jgi:hypothetical protein